MDRLILEDMIWPEVAEVLPEIKVALIPVGSCEQHGPNTTFVTDTVRAYRIAKLLAGRCGHKVICFPPIRTVSLHTIWISHALQRCA